MGTQPEAKPEDLSDELEELEEEMVERSLAMTWETFVNASIKLPDEEP